MKNVITVNTIVNGHTIEAALNTYTDAVTISQDGHFAGRGVWHRASQTIGQCDAVLGGDTEASERAYEELDTELAAALGSEVAPKYVVRTRVAGGQWSTDDPETYERREVAQAVADELARREPTNDDGQDLEYRVFEA